MSGYLKQLLSVVVFFYSFMALQRLYFNIFMALE